MVEGASQGGAVVVTRFACHTRRDIVLLWWLHIRLKPAVRVRAPGLLGVRLFIDWRHRIVRSVSLWTDPARLYDMGEVREHVAAARIPRRRGIATSCGVYTYKGDWRKVMFGVEPATAMSPLTGQPTNNGKGLTNDTTD
jgi:hypothetical protein